MRKPPRLPLAWHPVVLARGSCVLGLDDLGSRGMHADDAAQETSAPAIMRSLSLRIVRMRLDLRGTREVRVLRSSVFIVPRYLTVSAAASVLITENRAS